MADPKTLVEFATQWRDEQKTQSTQAASAVSAAQSQVTAAQASLSMARGELSASTDQLVAIRTQLGKIPMPADGEPLLVALREAIATQRAKAAAVTSAELAAGLAQATLTSAQLRLERLTKALASAESELAAATAAKNKRQAALDALAASPVADVKQAATDALASADYTAAKQRIKDSLPATLLARVTERAGLATGLADRQAALADAVLALADTESEVTTLAGDKLTRLTRALDQAERNLMLYTSRATADLASAVANLSYLANTGNNVLTPQQKAHLNDAALSADRNSAAQAESERDVAAVALADALKVLQGERAKVLAADPAADLTALEADGTSDLGKAKTAWQVAKDTLDKAGTGKEVLYTSAMRATMTEWQASVPDALWADLSRWLDADAALARLKGATTALTSAVKNTEKELVLALIDDAKRRRRQAWLVDALAARQGAVAEGTKRQSELRGHALRGILTV
ncbi:hypothetical protein HNQ59_002445 [Chitinivorax tropicus]|uniref:Uncharacterized protein n=1 Tax=Chitinivorax tropicus TaxID=714531 RepID=A0A840MQ16_9PROT|nr:hypothetical protein [Chitinivorax tropicus]MBB5019147.1 hypothetical protein [Chitinivorax tropicus]